MYMEPISGGTNPGMTAQMAVWQQAAKTSGKASAKVSDKAPSKTPISKAQVSNMTSPKTAVKTFAETAVSKASDNDKAAQADKKESTDGAAGAQALIGADGSVTLSIQADKKQLLDEQKNVSMEKLRKIMEQMRESIPNADTKFGIHEKTNRIMIKLVDKDTQEVIKEIPPEKNLDMLAKTLVLAGVLVDQRL